MSTPDILAILSGGVIGLVSALIGGGGSILATPALLYVVGVSDPHVAIGTSAIAVSINAFVGVANHARRGNVKWPCAATFAASGLLGALGGAEVGKATDPSILMPLFALGMIALGAVMLRPRGNEGDQNTHLTWKMAPRLIGAGLLVGLLSGFFGIGGGFLIVPGLLAATGMTMLHAVGSSLLSVGAFGAATAGSYALDGLIDWRVSALFVSGGIVGGFAGASIATRLAKQRNLLTRLFSIVLFGVAAYILWRTLGA